MELRQLRYFIAIVEQGSFSRAAHHLRVAQPALSQHLRHMEADLGQELLLRGPRGVTPTEAGETLLRHARRIVAQVEHARDELRREGEAPRGAVRFGVPGTVSQLLSVPLIEEVRRHHPQVKLRMAEAMSGFITGWLREGRVDLGVVYRAIQRRGLVVQPILSEELRLVGPPGSGAPRGEPPAVAFAEAARRELILPGPDHGLRELLEEVAHRQRVRLRVELELDAYAQIKLLVARGSGFSILPRTAIEAEVARGELAAWRVRRPALERKLCLAYAADRPLPRAARAVEASCRAVLARLVREGAWTATLAEEPEGARAEAR